MHVHISLVDEDGTNVFAESERRCNAKQYLALGNCGFAADLA